MDPLVALGWGVARLSQLRHERADGRLCSPGIGQRQGLLRPVLASSFLRQRHCGPLLLLRLSRPRPLQVFPRRRSDVAEQIVRFHVACEGIIIFEEEPLRLLGRLSRPDQMAPTLQLGAEQLEPKMPLGELGFRVARCRPHAVVKLGDVPATVLPFRDVSFEAGVVYGWSSTSTAMRLTLGS